MGRSTEYYRNNTKARKKKAQTDKKINQRPEQVRKRVEANRARRRAKKRGVNVSGKDYDHRSNKFIPIPANRGARGEGGRKTKKVSFKKL